MAIQHELSWSSSRAGNFAECRRRYYFDYYFSWSGWNATADAGRRQAYLLKKMTRMPMLAGDLVHQAIARYYGARDAGAQWPEVEARAWALNELREGYRTSRDGKWKMRPSKLTHLAEHHYEEPAIDESTGEAATYGKRYVERIETSLSTFYNDPALEEARSVEPGDTLGCEEMSTFELFGTKIYAVPDFAYRSRGGEVVVYDWKTGRPSEKDRFQLAVYVEYAEAKWGVDPATVVCRNTYLGTGEHVEHRMDAAEREQMRERIQGSIAGMRKVHFNADKSAGDPADFPQIPADAAEARSCKSCNYRELCDRV